MRPFRQLNIKHIKQTKFCLKWPVWQASEGEGDEVKARGKNEREKRARIGAYARVSFCAFRTLVSLPHSLVSPPLPPPSDACHAGYVKHSIWYKGDHAQEKCNSGPLNTNPASEKEECSKQGSSNPASLPLFCL